MTKTKTKTMTGKIRYKISPSFFERFILREICSSRDLFFKRFERFFARFFERFYPLRYPWEKDLLRISQDPSRDSFIDSSFSIVVELMMEEV